MMSTEEATPQVSTASLPPPTAGTGVWARLACGAMALLRWGLRRLQAAWAATPPARQRKLKIAGIVALIILVPLQIYLKFGLTPVVRKYAIPEVEKLLGVPVKVDSAAVSLLGIKARVSGLTVGNPPGFTEPTAVSLKDVRVNVGPSRMLVGVAEVESLRIKGLKLTVVRNSAGETNVVKIQEMMAAHAPTGAVATASTSTNAPAPFRLGYLKADALLEYIDYQAPTNAPFRLGYAVLVKADDMAVYKPWFFTNHWGTFSVEGHLDGKPDALLVNIKGKIAPIGDPNRPTFTVDGVITNLDMADLGPLATEAGFRSGRLWARIHVVCKNGIFHRESVVTLHAEDLKVAGGAAKRFLGVAIPSSLTADVQLKGTVREPDFDLFGTLMRTTGRGLSHGVDAVMGGANGFFKWLTKPSTNRNKSSSAKTND